MLNPTQQGKVERFLDDKMMSDAVHDVILQAFLKPKAGRDVYQLAASRLSIDMLEEAWKELEQSRRSTDDVSPKGAQIGM